MMKDETLNDNICMLVETLENLEIDVRAWFDDCDFSLFDDEDIDQPRRDDCLFACGYLQATGNLTGQTWVQSYDVYKATCD